MVKNKEINKTLKQTTEITEIEHYNENIKKHHFKYKKNCFISIILQQSKDALITYIPNTMDRFALGGHTYLSVAQGKYLNHKMQISIYLEGVMLPIEHSFIQYDTVYTLYFDREGLPVNDITKIERSDLKLLFRDDDGNFVKNSHGYYVTDVQEQIKGFDFDSKTADVLFESGLTDRMSQDRGGKVLPLLTVMNFLILIFIIINIAVSYLY